MKRILYIILAVVTCSIAKSVNAQELTANDIQLPSVSRQMVILDEVLQFKPDMLRDKDETAKSFERAFPWAKGALAAA